MGGGVKPYAGGEQSREGTHSACDQSTTTAVTAANNHQKFNGSYSSVGLAE